MHGTGKCGSRHVTCRQVEDVGRWQTGGFRQKLEDCMKQLVTPAGSGQSDGECWLWQAAARQYGRKLKAQTLTKQSHTHKTHTLKTGTRQAESVSLESQCANNSSNSIAETSMGVISKHCRAVQHFEHQWQYSALTRLGANFDKSAEQYF